jgi:galactose-1-phosphate uridylyltransferase
MPELRKDPRFRYILIFKNHGREAGATAGSLAVKNWTIYE